MRRLVRVTLPALLILSALIAPVRVVAHAELVTADPGAGSEIERLPETLRLIFSEPLDTAGTAVVLLDGAGRTIVEGIGRLDPDDPRSWLIDRASLPEDANEPGSYSLRWKSRSATDGHSAAGEIPYGIIDPESGEVPGLIGGGGHGAHGGLHIGHSSGQILVEVWGRTVGAVGLGVALALALIAPLLGAPLRRRRLGGFPSPASLPFIAGGALLNAGGVDLLLALLVVAPTPLLVVRIGVELVGALAVALLSRRGERGALTAAAIAAAVGLLLRAASSHGAALGVGEALSYLLHLIAVGSWFVALGSVAWVAWRRRWRTLARLLPRVGAVALVAGGVVALTGLAGALAELGEPRALFETEYGQVLLVKLALVAAAFSFGAINLVRGARPSGPLGLRGRSIAEMLLLGAAAIAAANLGASSPPGPAAPVRLVVLVDALDLAGGYPASVAALRQTISVGIAPGRPGPNRLIINGLSETPKWGTPTVELTRLDERGERRIRAVREPGADLASADIGLLPAGSRWSISVIPAGSDGREITRLSYRLSLDERGLVEGVDPTIGLIEWLVAGSIAFVGAALLLLRRRLSLAQLDRALLERGLSIGGAALLFVGLLLVGARLLG